VQASEAAFDDGLADDLNTAQALAAIFDLVRDVNTAIDREEFQKDNAAVVLAAFQKFNRILAVLDDNDEEKLRLVGLVAGPPALSDSEVEALVQQRQEARRMRNFKRGDEIRQQLADNGIILEDNKQGNVTWKRK
jgi:cysteinyl-tRNA synthetase